MFNSPTLRFYCRYSHAPITFGTMFLYLPMDYCKGRMLPSWRITKSPIRCYWLDAIAPLYIPFVSAQPFASGKKSIFPDYLNVSRGDVEALPIRKYPIVNVSSSSGKASKCVFGLEFIQYCICVYNSL